MPKGIPNKKAPAPAAKKPPGRPPVKPLPPPKPEPAKVQIFHRYLIVETNPNGGIQGHAVAGFPGGKVEEAWEQRYEQGDIIYIVHIVSRLVLSGSQREFVVDKINQAIQPPAVAVPTS